MFVPESVSEPVLDFVTVPVPIAIAPDTVVVPAPSMVRFVLVPEMPPDMVSVEPESTWISEATLRVTAADMTLTPETFRIAPIELVPLPLMVTASPIVTEPERASVAVSATVVEPAVVPSAALLAAVNVPPDTVVAPL